MVTTGTRRPTLGFRTSGWASLAPGAAEKADPRSAGREKGVDAVETKHVSAFRAGADTESDTQSTARLTAQSMECSHALEHVPAIVKAFEASQKHESKVSKIV